MRTARLNYQGLRAAGPGLLACFLVMTTGRAWGDPPSQSLFIGGAQYSAPSQFAYAGAIIPFAGGTLGQGFYVSPFFGWSRYTFLNNGTEITGSEPAPSLAIGRAWSGKRYSLSLSIAGGYSNTSLSPYAPPGSFRGAEWFAEPEVYAQVALPAKASLTVNGGYLTGLRSFWVSTYAMAPLTGRFSAGAEADFGGGINYSNHAFAMRLADQFTNQLTLTASLGAMANVPGNYHPYIALAVSLPFQ
jgi:hypothetical protein